MSENRKRSLLCRAALCALAIAAAPFAAGQEPADPTDSAAVPAVNSAPTPAQELGLEAYAAPDGIFPLFAWDHLGAWGNKHMKIEETVRSMAECGFSMTGFVDSEKHLRLARENGLYSMVGDDIDLFSDDEMTEEEFAEEAAKVDARVKEMVAATKDNPLVMGYKLVDEPSPDSFRSIGVAVAAVKKYAPGKLAYVNLFPGYAGKLGDSVDTALQSHSYEEYLEKFVRIAKPQFLSYDNYMVEVSEDGRNPDRFITYFTDLLTARRVAQKYELPLWYIGSSLSQMEESSPPTAARYAYQAYTALAAGAEGLAWFLYFPYVWEQSPVDFKGHKTLSWTYMRDVNEQVQVVGGYLRDYRSTDVGLSALFTKEECPAWPDLPAPPENVLVNLRYRFSRNASEELAKTTDEDRKVGDEINPYGFEPKIMVGEFAQKSGDKVAALAVNLNFGTSMKVFFDLPDGYSSLKVLNPIDGYEEPVDEETREMGFWLLPGHGRLFIMEKSAE